MQFRALEQQQAKSGHCYPLEGGILQLSGTKSFHFTKGGQKLYKNCIWKIPFGVIDDTFYFQGTDDAVHTAQILKNEIYITHAYKLEPGKSLEFKADCMHYFIERPDYPDGVYGVPINKNCRNNVGCRFSVTMLEVRSASHAVVEGETLVLYNDGEEGEITAQMYFPLYTLNESNEIKIEIDESVSIFHYKKSILYFLNGSLNVIKIADGSKHTYKQSGLTCRDVAIKGVSDGTITVQAKGSPVKLFSATLPDDL